MRRREFIAGFGSSVAWPGAARAQQHELPVVGLLLNAPAAGSDYLTAPFLEGLRDSEFVEGRSVAIEYRWGDGENERMPALAAELVARRVAVIVSITGATGAIAAKRLTSTIPIVFLTSGDAVQLGLVTNLNKPEANLTGASGLGNLLVTKQFGLLSEFVPKPASFGLLTNRTSPNLKPLIGNTEAAAKSVGRELHVVAAGDEAELDQAFAELAERRVGGLVVPVSAFFQAQRLHIIALAARFHIPTIYDLREFTDAGGLNSYGINEPDVRRQLGIYTAKILRGASPSDLPVFQPTKFQLVINLKTAKALGIEIPFSMQLLADEVIE
jgi:ABC-type uncharacterized transport system substrate-binding protein